MNSSTIQITKSKVSNEPEDKLARIVSELIRLGMKVHVTEENETYIIKVYKGE